MHRIIIYNVRSLRVHHIGCTGHLFRLYHSQIDYITLQLVFGFCDDFKFIPFIQTNFHPQKLNMCAHYYYTKKTHETTPQNPEVCFTRELMTYNIMSRPQ